MEPHGRVPEENEKGGDVSPPTPLTRQENAREAKATKILEACKAKDTEVLRILATSEGGLLSDDARRQAWPLLLGNPRSDINIEVKSAGGAPSNWKELPKHRDEDQVRLDVDRSFIYYPNNQSAREIDQRKSELSDLILEVLRRQPYLHYFQGYHDICQVLLLVLEPHRRSAAVARLSALRIRDYMLPTLAPSLAQLRLIPSIIHAVNPRLYHHLPLNQPFFAIPGILTMYAHDIQEYGDIARVFDVLLAREAVFSVYMFAQIMLQRSDELFDIPSDEPEMLHSVLSKLPKPLELDTLIKNTAALYERHPPETLKTWRSISKYSVLKTARWPNQTITQSLEDGMSFFANQVKELQRQEQQDRAIAVLWKYRRPAQTIGLAVLVGVLSFWLRKSSGPSGVFGTFWRYWSGHQRH